MPVRHAIATLALLLGSAGAAHADAPERAEIDLARHAAIDSLTAIHAATRHVQGRPYAVGVEVARRGHWYEVIMATAHGAVTVRVDDRTGRVLGQSPAESDDAGEAPYARSASISLAKALQQVEQAHPGPVLEVGLDGRGNALGYLVTVIEHGKPVSWRVDARSGTLSSHPVKDPD
jgi:uncharacterized membrane protein YkoI